MREPVKIKFFYFLYSSAIASWMGFFNVHLENIGFTGLQIGTLNSIFISTSLLVVPLGGMISDRYGSNRILLIITLMSTVFVYFIGFGITYSYILLFILLLSFFQSPMGTVIDGMTLGLVKNNPKYAYGQFRLWASAGYAFGALLAGYVVGFDSSKIFLVAAIFFGMVSLLNLITLPPKPVTGRGLVNFKSFGVFFRDKQILTFFILIFIFGVSISPLHFFINLYYTEIGATGTQIGIAIAVQASFEIPFFLFGVRYLRRNSPESIIIIAMFITVARMILYGFISNPNLAILVGTMHGFTISFFIIGVVEYIQTKTPSHLRTTGQSLIWTFHFGAGLMMGNIWIGYMKDIIGMKSIMHLQAVIAAVIVAVIVQFFRKNGFSMSKFRKTNN